MKNKNMVSIIIIISLIIYIPLNVTNVTIIIKTVPAVMYKNLLMSALAE